MILSSRMTVPSLRFTTLLILAAAAAGADTYPRQPGVDVQHYTFRISVNDESDEISGSAILDVRFTSDGVENVALDLVSAANGKGMTVTGVTSSGGAIPYKHENSRLVISLPARARAGERRQFTVDYHGVPAGGLSIGKNKFGERTFFSNNWPDMAREWLPVIDHPYDKASSEFLVTAPAKYQVVANGVLEEERDLDDGRRLTHWSQREPIATWLNNIGVARFSSRHIGSVSGIPLQTWVFPQDRDAGSSTFDGPMRQAIEFFQSRIGPYPYDKLAAVQATSFSGGMENASAIFYGEKSVTGKPAFGLVAHEVAHQWFGDSVTEKDWDDVWLSEGFATYFSMLAIEHYEGRDAFAAALRQARQDVFKAEKKLPGIAVIQTKPWNGIPNAIVYRKGAWTLHMLRNRLGDEKFWTGIREYYRLYRDSNASTADFINVMEESSGMDLDSFFRQWLDRAGSPVLEGGWKYNPQSRTVTIELSQAEAGDAYRLPVEFGVFFADKSKNRMEKIEMDQKRQTFEVSSPEEPVQVVLDPDTRILFDGHFRRL
ncbi:MAG TPA: M1 family metallopeptidase [Bryobacteraceae bacterium]|nr:M1 family metallopeptidase [Bryobacteraceae bacterium]